jgi:hypothetical protein
MRYCYARLQTQLALNTQSKSVKDGHSAECLEAHEKNRYEHRVQVRCGVRAKIACRVGRQKRGLAVESGGDRVVEQLMGLQEKVQRRRLAVSASLPMLVSLLVESHRGWFTAWTDETTPSRSIKIWDIERSIYPDRVHDHGQKHFGGG